MKLLNQKQSRAAIDSGKVLNGYCETPGKVALPSGHPDAERVGVSINRKTGKEQMHICAPWLLCDVFAVKGGSR